jgi:predicted ribosomally synthesized peptide with SipW-like signal peptide
MMKKRTLLMSALAVVLAAGMTIAPAMAYFTDHTEANGSVTVELGTQTTIDEEIDGMNKIVTIHNDGPESVYVRVNAYAGSDLDLTFSGEGWSARDGEGWSYYSGIIEAGQDSGPLTIAIDNLPEGAMVGDDVNVSVVYEATKVIYDNDEAQAPDWDLAAVIAPTEEGGED